MTTALARLFFEYEEMVSLYIETRNPACRLRAIVLRGELIDVMLACNVIEVWELPTLRDEVPDWLADKEN